VHPVSGRVADASAPGLADEFTDLIFNKVKATDGRITAKRLLLLVRAAGYAGSARTLRHVVAVQKSRWKRARRVYRPWTPEPGQHLLIDYGTLTCGPNTGLKVFTAVLAWSRWRFVRFCRDESLETTLRLLAECFEALGGLKRLRAENMELRRANEILKVASALFARELGRPRTG
jgi:transposase